MRVENFIERTLINEIKDIMNNCHHYLTFNIIAQGIEFLGACIERYEFNIRGKSEKRFKLAIKNLFPDEYEEPTNLIDWYRNKLNTIHPNGICIVGITLGFLPSTLLTLLYPNNYILSCEDYFNFCNRWRIFLIFT